jgi:hypothetical protein
LTHTAKHEGPTPLGEPRGEAAERAVERFAKLVAERVASLAQGSDRAKIIALAKRALTEARVSLAVEHPFRPSHTLPVSRMKASDVVAQGLVNLSQATLYRAVESGRFYSTTPKGRSIGKEFPTWQFVEPVPELIDAVLPQLAGQPSSEIHAFWVSASDELNELSPAEMLAGKPFESRNQLHESQQYLLNLPTSKRLHTVQALAAVHSRGMAEVIG